MVKKFFRVTNENNLYFGRVGTLVYKNSEEVLLRVDCGDYDENVSFDETEVTEV